MKIPKELAKLSKTKKYSLTKVLSKRSMSMVFTDDTVVGKLKFVEVIGKCGILVSNENCGDHDIGYIRTSPIQKIIYKDDRQFLIETEGGVYRLELL